MASTGNPSVQGGLQWPQWNSSTGLGVNIVDAMSVGVVNDSQCVFWDVINNKYLNFTSLSANGTSGNSSTGKGQPNGAERGVGVGGAWGFTLAVGIAVSVLMG
jgi:hypothetical protein